MPKIIAASGMAVLVCVALVSADRPGGVAAGQEVAVRGYVNNLRVSTQLGPARCTVTVSDGKHGAGQRWSLYATDPLLQTTLMSGAERQVLVEIICLDDERPGRPQLPPPDPVREADTELEKFFGRHIGRIVSVRLVDLPNDPAMQGRK